MMETKKFTYKGIEVTFNLTPTSYRWKFEYKKKPYGNAQQNLLSPISEANMRSIVRCNIEKVLAAEVKWGTLA